MRNIPGRLVGGLFACAIVGVLGCSIFAKKIIEDPKVELDNVSVTDVGLTGATVIFGVKVSNPNSFALKVDSVKYDVEIAGKQIGSSTLPDGAKVEGKSTTIIPIPVPVKYKDVFSSMLDLMGHGSTKYRLRGLAKLGPLSLPFDHTGDLDLHGDKNHKDSKKNEKAKKESDASSSPASEREKTRERATGEVP